MHPLIDPAGIRFAAARLDARHCHTLIIGAGRGQTHIWCLRRTGTNFGAQRCRATRCSGVLLGRSQADLPRRGFFEDDHVAATARARPREVGEVAACVGEAVEGWPAQQPARDNYGRSPPRRRKEAKSDRCAQSRAATRVAETGAGIRRLSWPLRASC